MCLCRVISWLFVGVVLGRLLWLQFVVAEIRRLSSLSFVFLVILVVGCYRCVVVRALMVFVVVVCCSLLRVWVSCSCAVVLPFVVVCCLCVLSLCVVVVCCRSMRFVVWRGWLLWMLFVVVDIVARGCWLLLCCCGLLLFLVIVVCWCCLPLFVALRCIRLLVFVLIVQCCLCVALMFYVEFSGARRCCNFCCCSLGSVVVCCWLVFCGVCCCLCLVVWCRWCRAVLSRCC